MSLAQIFEYIAAFFRGLGDLAVAAWYAPIPFGSIPELLGIAVGFGIILLLPYLIYQWARQIYLAVAAWRAKQPSE